VPYGDGGVTLRGFLAMIRRRKWIVVLSVVLVPAVAVAVSMQQPKRYQAAARVLLSWQDLANQLTGTGGSSVAQQPDRLAQTQASVARTSAVAQRVLAEVPGTGLTPGGLLAESSVSTNPNADILIFSVTSGDPAQAARLANAYARQYTIYRRTLDNAAIVRARASVQAALRRLDAQGGAHSQLHSDLLNRDQTLATMEALQTSNASVLQQAGGASQTQPRTKRNVLLALVLGLIVGLAIAYLWETLDTRVRYTDDIVRYLGGVPLLVRLPAPGKRLEGENKLVTIEEPVSPTAESFRMLRTNLRFVTIDRHIRTIMVTSAMEEEGKSSTVANLAVVLAQSDQRVILVDLDLRRPRIASFFGLVGPGISQVAMGWEPLEKALVPIDIPGAIPRQDYLRREASEDARRGEGQLEVLPAGAIPPDKGAFFDSEALTDVLESLRERADIVLIDSPPALQAGDTTALSRKVDGILVVARLNVVRRPMLQELARLLALSPARVLGCIATGVGRDAIYELGYGYDRFDPAPEAPVGSVQWEAGETGR
jgi:polysaccharide biosynthesis transport protein